MRAYFLTLVALLLSSPAALADDWKDESGKGKREYKHEYKREGGGAWKEEYHDGACKVERKMERSGEYKEEVKCKGAPWARGYPAPIGMPGGVQIVIDLPVSLPALPRGPQYGRSYRDAGGQYCREYQTVGMIEGRRQPLYGVACAQPGGTWIFND